MERYEPEMIDGYVVDEMRYVCANENPQLLPYYPTQCLVHDASQKEANCLDFNSCSPKRKPKKQIKLRGSPLKIWLEWCANKTLVVTENL